jgi:hypothetical protein
MFGLVFLGMLLGTATVGVVLLMMWSASLLLTPWSFVGTLSVLGPALLSFMISELHGRDYLLSSRTL